MQLKRPYTAGLASMLICAGLSAGPCGALAQATSAAESVGQGANLSIKGPELKTQQEKNSYATGVMTARNMTRNKIPFDVDLMMEGIRDGLSGGALRLSEKELRMVVQSMQVEIQRNLTGDMQRDAIRNAQRGEAFASEFARSPDVVQLPGGLMYRVITTGTGDRPTELGTVVVRYSGKHVDGKAFDATPEGKTATLKLANTITGLREVFKRMPAGSTWEVLIPPSLAYGNKGQDRPGSAERIGPNETLLFTVELVAVVQ